MSGSVPVPGRPDRPLRVLLLARQLNASTSGVGTYAAALVNALAGRGYTLSVAVPADEVGERTDVRTIRLPLGAFDPTPQRWLAASRAFAGVLRTEGGEHDVAHFVDAREAWAVRRSPIPLVGTVNDTYALDWVTPSYPRSRFADRGRRSIYYGLLRAAEPRAYRRLAGLVANSERVRRHLVDGYGADPARIEVIHYGVTASPEAEPESLPGEPAILFVGGNYQRKGLGVLLEALARLVPRLEDPRVHVVGNDRDDRLFRRRVRQLGLEDRVVFHGWLPNPRVRTMMAGADLFALPSVTEAFGIVYVEALLAGCPVVASRWSGAADLFGAEGALEAVDPVDPGEVAAAVERLWSGLRRSPSEMAERARRAGAALTVERMADETVALYRRVLSAAGPAGAALPGRDR